MKSWKQIFFTRIGVLISTILFASTCYSQGNLESDLVLDFFSSIYNYDIQGAERNLAKVKKELKEEPEAGLCETNYYWWLMMMGEENEKNRTAFENANLKLIDDLGKVAPEKLSPDEVFAIIHAYAYQTRYSLHHKKYGKGISNIKKIGPYLDRVMENPELNEKYKFIGGLFHYSLAVSREEKPLLKPLFNLAPESNKDLGIRLLKEATNSPHPLIRTEAKYFIMKIELEIAHKNDVALVWSRSLMNSFPNNILYQYYVLSALSELGFKNSCQLQQQEIVRLSECLPGLNSAQRAHFQIEGNTVLKNIK